jgi:hypothetical protein
MDHINGQYIYIRPYGRVLASYKVSTFESGIASREACGPRNHDTRSLLQKVPARGRIILFKKKRHFKSSRWRMHPLGTNSCRETVLMERPESETYDTRRILHGMGLLVPYGRSSRGVRVLVYTSTALRGRMHAAHLQIACDASVDYKSIRCGAWVAGRMVSQMRRNESGIKI